MLAFACKGVGNSAAVSGIPQKEIFGQGRANCSANGLIRSRRHRSSEHAAKLLFTARQHRLLMCQGGYFLLPMLGHDLGGSLLRHEFGIR